MSNILKTIIAMLVYAVLAVLAVLNFLKATTLSDLIFTAAFVWILGHCTHEISKGRV